MDDKTKAKIQYFIRELQRLLNQLASGYQPNPKIAEYIDEIIRWLSEHGIGGGVV